MRLLIAILTCILLLTPGAQARGCRSGGGFRGGFSSGGFHASSCRSSAPVFRSSAPVFRTSTPVFRSSTPVFQPSSTARVHCRRNPTCRPTYSYYPRYYGGYYNSGYYNSGYSNASYYQHTPQAPAYQPTPNLDETEPVRHYYGQYPKIIHSPGVVYKRQPTAKEPESTTAPVDDGPPPVPTPVKVPTDTLYSPKNW